MRGRMPVVGALLSIALAYAAYPYVTLYRLGSAIRSGDASSLQAIVDWPAVREGIKEDICDLVIDQPAEAKRGEKLPPFGAGFMRGIATNAVDARITPEGLVAAAQQQEAKPASRGGSLGVSWAFFASPTEFLVDLRASEQNSPIRLQMNLREGRWQVTRVWLPAELLSNANART